MEDNMSALPESTQISLRLKAHKKLAWQTFHNNLLICFTRFWFNIANSDQGRP